MGSVSFPRVSGERVLGKGGCTLWVPHSSVHPLHASPVPFVRGGLGLEPLSSLELILLPFLRRPRHPPASRPHGPEPRHGHPCATSTVRSQPDISLPRPPWRSRFPEQPSPHHWDPSPAWRVHHYVRKAIPVPPKPQPGLSGARIFISDYSRTSV